MNYKTAVVTGASSGIGEAIAKSLASQGLNLVLIARREDKLNALKASLGDSTHCFVLPCDLNKVENIDEQLAKIPEEFSHVDVLVNCAGAALGLDTAQESNWQDWQKMIDVNCTALIKLTHYFLPNMVAKNQGHIVNIGSIAGTYPYKGGNVYGATKAFVKQFTLNLKADLLGTAVRVSDVQPGMVSDSEFSLVRFNGDTKQVEKTYEGLDALSSQDIANAVSWVLNQPANVNINRIEIMPVCQAPARTAFAKKQ